MHLVIATVFWMQLLCVQFCTGIVNIDPEKQARIDEFVTSLITDCEKHDIVGMNLAVVHQGEILYTTGYGLKNIESGDPVTEHTIYNIASTTKHFTTTLLGQSLQNAGYSWDTPVRGILSDLGVDFHFLDPLRSNMTTMRDLASHSLGINRNDFLWIYQGMSRAEVTSRLRFLEAVREPRTSFIYNNLFFTLMGHITELLEGRSWEDIMQTEAFDKVGMPNSSFMYSVEGSDPNLATPYYPYVQGLREVAWSAFSDLGEDSGPAGAITTTANDMARWMMMLLSGGQNEAGQEVFSSDVIAETRAPVNAHSVLAYNPYTPPLVPVSYEPGITYGLGLGQGSYRGYRLALHGGALFGHYSAYHLFPDIGLGIFTAINGVESSQYSAMNHVAMFVADLVMDEEPWLNSTTACTFPEPFFSTETKHTALQQEQDINNPIYNIILPHMHTSPLKSEPVKSRELVEQYMGQYGNFGYGNLTVVADDVTEELFVNFDVFTCRLINGSLGMTCIGQDNFWFLGVSWVSFDEENNPSGYVDVVFAINEGVVRFERSLTQEEAPGPRDHWPQCPDVFLNHKSKPKNKKVKFE